MESAELARWQRFASKGGIGRSTAVVDCVAERDGDLMFLKDDEVTVLMQLPEAGFYLGFCEGVVGRFALADVQVHGKLKRAVMARRPASGASSPTGSPVHSVSPTPSIPHTTYSPIRPPIDLLMTNARAENSLTGVSTQLVSSNIDEPETEPDSKLISSSPPSSPLRVNTTTATADSQRESLNSLASTEASPLSDSSVYSFRRRNADHSGQDQDDLGLQLDESSQVGNEDVRQEQGQEKEREQDQDQDAEREGAVLSPRSHNTSNSRASSVSLDDPFHHDDPTGIQSPSTPNHEDVNKVEEPLYSDSRDSVYSDLRPDSASRPERVSAALSDGEVGIGLTLLGGLLGAGRDSMAESKDGDSDGSESDYGREEGYGVSTGATAEQLDDVDDDTSLYHDDSYETAEAGNSTITEQGEVHGATTPIPNSNGRLSPESNQSRSSTPPFGFELDPTVHHGTDLDGPAEESVDEARPASIIEPQPVTSDEPRSPLQTQNETAGSESDDESDYGQPEPAPTSESAPTSPTSFISKQSASSQNQNPEEEQEFDPMLPPVRPPYHRASSSMRSIVSSDGGGYYDDGIYDHYRYSHVSMAARSMRFSIIGNGGEMPPLPSSGSGGVAPLNLQKERSGSVSGSQVSPKSFGPMSPRSLLGQERGEPASPKSMGSPLAAGSMMQAQMETKPEVETKESSPPAALSRLAPITTSNLAPASPGALAVPLSPTPSIGPPSPALSANLASSLRQAIEQQRAETLESEPEQVPEYQDDAESIDEDKPILASPIMIQGTQTGSPIANLQRRPSQFAPHPNAPKTADHFPSTAPVPAPPPPNPTTEQPSHLLLHDALQLVVQRLRTGGPRIATPTIHGRTHSELALSSGPVPISFLFDPDGRSVSNMAGRIAGGAQRSASMNVNMNSHAGAGGGEYVGSRLRPRSRSFSGMPQEQISALRSTGEPSTPTLQSEFKAPQANTPVTSSPLAQLSTSGPPQTPSVPPLTPIVPSTPAQMSDSPSHSPTSATSSSPVKRVASPPSSATPSSSGMKSPFRGLRHVASNTMMRVGLGSISIPSSPVPQRAESPPQRQRQSNEVSRPPTETHDTSSASPLGPINPKTSLTSLRMTRETPTTPLSPVGSVQLADETVHVHDMDFDLVKPKRSRVSLIRTSEDAASRRSHQSERPGEDESHASAPTSPTTTSPSHQTRGSVPASLVPLSSGHNSLTSPAEIAAHVSREQRWITTMQTVPSSSVRRNKKIKKLLLEGVPASVRGVVWLYMTDSKARRMAGLYSQLSKRGKVPATPEILKDLEICFPTQPHLQAPDGSVVNMLQAYLTMIPDIAYSQGLCQIAGNLLMHSPEEDAFWTFVALMDNYLRGYCAVNSLQMEADSAFFAKTLESNDPQLATKLFRELGLGAVDFCKPWILSGFTAAVPYEYGCRIWDTFLFEGAPFLFRVALALLGYLKKQLMALTLKSSPGALACLLSISPQHLPSDPDQLIAAAYAVKFKEDDMRKMRPKIEAQLRKESGLNRPGAIRDALKK